MTFMGLDSLQWTALAAIAGFLLAATAVITIIVTVRLAAADRRRADTEREQDRKWDSERRAEDRAHDAEQRRQDPARDDQLRREADQKWEARCREEQQGREDNDAQEQVTIELLPGGPLSRAQEAVTTGDGITHRIIVTTTTAAYPIKQVEAQIAHQTNSGTAMFPPGWSFGQRVHDNALVQRTWHARVPSGVRDPETLVRFTDRHGNLYYSYHGYTRRFRQNIDWPEAATTISQWWRTGPKPDELKV
jgi:hypothetical protein